jgi:DNA-binding transcriptional regulator YiaG
MAVKEGTRPLTPEDLSRIVWVREMVRLGVTQKIRRAAGLSIDHIAEAAEVDPSTVYRWEIGERVPRAQGALRYARVLDALMERR